MSKGGSLLLYLYLYLCQDGDLRRPSTVTLAWVPPDPTSYPSPTRWCRGRPPLPMLFPSGRPAPTSMQMLTASYK